MADDLDDLLDEVESKFCKDSPTKKPGKIKTVQPSAKKMDSKQQPSTSRVGKSRKEGDDLNDIIRDICADDGPDLSLTTPPAASSSNSNLKETSGHKFKCFNLILGGSQCSKGLCTVSEQRTCDQLRCTSCDFKVVMFDNYEWQRDCDYLFFRNNVPDFQKLKAKLITRRDVRAYACQCSWRSVKEATDILNDSTLKWVCGKHS
uniref:Cilia- and flagella-associated protein 418 n=1 Tax=Actinia tenebrosa TaxID=6105 RepID=A0A6P8HUU1_ACTTE